MLVRVRTNADRKAGASATGRRYPLPVVDRAADQKREDALLADIRVEFPRFRVVRKDRCRLQRAIHQLLCALTLGRMRGYLDHYQTTIGQTVYVTADWDRRSPAERYVTMRHERVHLRQFRTFTLPGMAVLYLLVPLPAGLAWCRARFEKQAYAETIRAAAEVHGVEHVRCPDFRDRILAQFTGPSYGWMWPFRRGIERWYDSVVASL
jgi:hypothetical protein